jgi:hypothetical protein
MSYHDAPEAFVKKNMPEAAHKTELSYVQEQISQGYGVQNHVGTHGLEEKSAQDSRGRIREIQITIFWLGVAFLTLAVGGCTGEG